MAFVFLLAIVVTAMFALTWRFGLAVIYGSITFSLGLPV
jgi:hypothetical protein